VVTRQVVLDANDPLVEKIKEKVLASERWGESLFCFVNYDYYYDKGELERAKVLKFRPTTLLRTYGERYGTHYDDSTACQVCGFGRVQRSPLIIDSRYLSKRKCDFLVTVTADEWVVSAKLAGVLQRFAGDECRLQPIHDSRGIQMADWFQLKVNGVFGSAVPPTRFGVDYFHPEDSKGEYVCSQHCLSGLNLLSELYVRPESMPDNWPALSITRDRIGRKAGWVVPAPLLLVTRKLADVLLESKSRGFELDVVHVL
jgi:hypothetical protein